MPRIGRHPLKVKGLKDEVKHRDVTVTTIVHIPMLQGYWEQSLEVLKLFFQSLFASTERPFDLMVFDNNSCAEVQDYLISLQQAGKIQYLTLSTYNLRKLGALNYLLTTAPGEYIAFADSDVYFLPGWLEASLNVLNVFPEAAKVTALPIVGGDTSKIAQKAFEQAFSDKTIAVQTGQLVPDKFVEAHRLSLGQSKTKYASRLVNRKDVLLSRNGTQALLSGADFQFTITKDALDKVLPLTVTEEEYYDPIYSPVLELRLKQAGYWLLSITEYLVHHMGNCPPDLDQELIWRNEDDRTQSVVKKRYSQTKDESNLKNRILLNRFFRRILRYLNRKTYELLYEK
jgi:glycosyltransferase involved in cell wall biosynthesis